MHRDKAHQCDCLCHREVQLEASVTDYFHEDGYLADAKWRSHVSKLLSEYERMDAASAPRPFALNPKKQQ